MGTPHGNTLSYGGDPAKGADAEQGRPMYPNEYLDLCEMIGQDALVFDAGLWTPYRRKNEKGELIPAFSRDVKTRADYEELILDSDGQIKDTKKYLKEYKKKYQI